MKIIQYLLFFLLKSSLMLITPNYLWIFVKLRNDTNKHNLDISSKGKTGSHLKDI